MKEQFVTYELALELKELGFNEPCFGGFIDDELRILPSDNGLTYSVGLYNVLAPLWQQAFDWFREKKDLLNHLTTHLNTWGEDGALEESYGYRIMINKDGWKCNVWEQLSRFETYQEAKLACLEKLIELIK